MEKTDLSVSRKGVKSSNDETDNSNSDDDDEDDVEKKSRPDLGNNFNGFAIQPRSFVIQMIG